MMYFAMKILFLSHLPVENQSARQRLVQYFPYFCSQGIEPTFWPSVPSALHAIKNNHGPVDALRKTLLLSIALLRRLFIDFPQFRRFDALFVHREVFPFFTPFFERLAQWINPRFILDFDDAVYVEPTHYRDWRSALRNSANFAQVVAGSAHVIAGNQVLADYARQHNNHVTIVPTALDLDFYPPKRSFDADPVVVGWTGAWATAPSLSLLAPVFERLARTERFRLKIIGNANIYDLRFPGVEVEYCLWKLGTMIDDLRSFDIGVMPLPDTPWERGKCGGKLLQYMALGIPAVASPVGANKVIITDGEDGFLASAEEKWCERLRALIRSAPLRRQVGARARQKMEARYSTRVTAPQLRAIVEQVAWWA
jgi:glycosyltransferase involved in cell wall biosynthesis